MIPLPAMSPKIKYWIFLGVINVLVFGVILSSFVASWYGLNAEEQHALSSLFGKLLPYPLLGALILCLLIGFLISRLFLYYIIPILQLAESTQLFSAVNPDHRIKIKRGAREINYLTDILNQSADAFAELQRNVSGQISSAKAGLKEERTRLAALMSELPHGVIVCNTDGQVLLYNQQAQQIFSGETGSADAEKSKGILGLGRSVFSLMDRDPIVHALELLHKRFESGTAKPVSKFMVTQRNGLCLRVNMAPVYREQNEKKAISGVVLTLEDMTKQIEADSRRDMLIQSLTDDLQAALGDIRGSITSILSKPTHDPDDLHSYRKTIDNASLIVQDKVDQARINYTRHLHALSTNETVLAENLLEVICKNVHDRLGVKMNCQAASSLWLQLDSYSMVQAITHLISLLSARTELPELIMTLTRNEQQEAELSIVWPGVLTDSQVVEEWQNTPLITDAQGKVFSFNDIVVQMSGNIEIVARDAGSCTGVLVCIPPLADEEHLSMKVSLEHRPISYEFDLFNQVESKELWQTPLSKLTYVVFDTETTGLHPSEGDEIIQLGALRIVNGKILYHETIDQLVDPRRDVPETSVAIHGIQPELLVGQPTINKVLPHFYEFCENSVLVAHNAAFDMRMLEVKQHSTGIVFNHPVLDTLLLSSVIHPHQDSHALEEIAKRFNLTIVGRHTALGDAIVTAEVLVSLIPLLEARGIHTLEDAIKASANSKFAKLRY